jgi:polar amino acid transport system ATP-binding protein
MEDLASGKKTTMIVVTHELAFAKKAATRIALMDAGRIVEEGSPHLIFDAPSSRVGKLYKSIMDRW